MPRKKSSTFKVKPSQLKDFVKEMIHEGNVRRIVIKDSTGKKYAEIPVTFGVLGFLVAPMLIAVAAAAAMVDIFEVEIIRSK